MSFPSVIVLPDDSAKPILDAIRSTSKSLRVKMFVFSDPALLEAVIAARRRGVKVRVTAKPPSTLKRNKLVEGVGGLRILDDVGIKVRKLKGLKLHGKMLLADGVAAIVGSINLTPGSFDDRRELAIEVRDDAIVERLYKVARRDWKHSRPLDLSDAGLLADLEDRILAAEKLAIVDGHFGRRRTG